jgi:hypothetical protein
MENEVEQPAKPNEQVVEHKRLIITEADMRRSLKGLFNSVPVQVIDESKDE